MYNVQSSMKDAHAPSTSPATLYKTQNIFINYLHVYLSSLQHLLNKTEVKSMVLAAVASCSTCKLAKLRGGMMKSLWKVCILTLLTCQVVLGHRSQTYAKVDEKLILEDPVKALRQTRLICNKLAKNPNFKILNPTIHEARIACNELDFSVLDEVEEEPRFLETYSLQKIKKGGRRKKKKSGIFSKICRALGGVVRAVGKVGKFVVKNVAKVAKILPAAALVFPPAAAAGAAAKAGGVAAKAGAAASKAGASAVKASAKAGSAGAKAGSAAAKAGKAAAKDGGKVSKFLNKVGNKFKNVKNKIKNFANGIKKGFSNSKLGKVWNKLPNQVKKVIKDQVQDTIMAKTEKIRGTYDVVATKLMAAKNSFAGKLAYSMMAGDNLLQFVAEEANGMLKERVDTVVELYTDQAQRYAQGDVALYEIEEVAYNINKGAKVPISKQNLLAETSYNCHCYLHRYGDLRKAFGNDCAKAWNHWKEHGMKENRNPACDDEKGGSRSGDAFDCDCYLGRYDDLRKSFGMDCAKASNHWIQTGMKEKRKATCDRKLQREGRSFDCECYLNRYPDLRLAFGKDCAKAKNHWKKSGMKEKRNSFCNDEKGADSFDCSCYLGRYADLLQAFGMDCAKASRHWILYGKKEKRNAACDDDIPSYDCNCYLDRYDDLRKAFGIDCAQAWKHWKTHGMKGKRNPTCDPKTRGKAFDCNCYLGRYADLRKAFGNDCLKASRHWIDYGRKEKRNPTCDHDNSQNALLEVSSFTNLVSYAEVGEHLYQSYHRINNPLTKARYLQTLCAELEEKKGIEALQKQCNRLDFSWIDAPQVKLSANDVSFLQKRTYLQRKKKKSLGKKLAKSFVSSSLGNFKSSFATIGGKIGKFVKKASDFLSSNNNVVGRLLNKVRHLKNVVVKKVFKVLDNADSFVAKFISRFPAPIRLKLQDVIQQPLEFLKGKIGEADNKLSSWLNPVETQLNRLKDRYIPDLAKEMMLEDNVPADDFENREVEDVSQEYIDQAKGTVESELDEKATAHVNKNIKKIDKELDTAEDKFAEMEKKEKERKEKELDRKEKERQQEEDRKEEDAKAKHEEETKRWEAAKKAEEETKEKDRKEAHEKKLEADRVAKLAERKKEETDKLAVKKEEQAVKAKSRAAEKAAKKAAAKAKEEKSKEEAAKSKAEEATKREDELQAKEVKSREEAAKSKAEEATKREKALPFLQAKEKNNEDEDTTKELKARARDISSKKDRSSRTSSVLELKNPAKTQRILASKRKTPTGEVRRRVPKQI